MALAPSSPRGQHKGQPTGRQLEIFAFIRGRVNATGHFPTFDEIKQHAGMQDRKSVMELLLRMERSGLLVITSQTPSGRVGSFAIASGA